MNWLMISLSWYLLIFIIGIIFLPLTVKIFNRFPRDFGYPFAKVLAIIFISYTAYVLGRIKLVPFTQFSLLTILAFFIIINGFVFYKKKSRQLLNLSISQSSFIFFEELLFLSSFLLWTFIRGQEPSIRSLEKFMDFGFINSILRSQFFPPADIWYSGFPINYYYFGHLAGSVLIKLINIKPAIGYNLILASIFALAITQVFSLVTNIITITSKKISFIKTIFLGLIGAFIVNLGGNLHTIYIFTTGYPNENPLPFWQILSGFNPEKYWYPNATRFIPNTIHEFPSYSYVVADLHGHVFDIPFVLLTLGILLAYFISFRNNQNNRYKQNQKYIAKIKNSLNWKAIVNNGQFLIMVFLGFLVAVHYMTNAFDGPIYFLLALVGIFFIYRFSFKSLYLLSIIFFSFLIFSLPFSSHFKPFISGIGVNCGAEILSYSGKLGPFLFEKGNCQISPFWMLFVLWGFFWINFLLFIFINRLKQPISTNQVQISNFILILFFLGTILVLIPEFFYIKDIYPTHFRANTMFKLGYQAFIMMGIASTYVLFLIKNSKKIFFLIIYALLFSLICLYPFFSIPSYYGSLNQPIDLDGSNWLKNSYPEDKEIIDWLNKNEKNQPVILEAQGDSYTDYERISAMTGLPTVAGWWVHEWLWRGSSDVIAKRIPDVVTIYESEDLEKTRQLIKKYQIKYIIVSRLEKQKYPKLYEDKFPVIGQLVLKSSNGLGALYQVN